MDFATNINRICRERNTTLTGVCKKLGLATNKVTMWNNGSLPKEEVMIQLAKELQCSVMDFFADEEDVITQHKPLLDEDEKELVRIFQSLDRRAKHEFMNMVYDFEKQFISEGDKAKNNGAVG